MSISSIFQGRSPQKEIYGISANMFFSFENFFVMLVFVFIFILSVFWFLILAKIENINSGWVGGWKNLRRTEYVGIKEKVQPTKDTRHTKYTAQSIL